MMNAHFLTVDDPRWPRFLHSVAHDFYHLPAYVRVAASHEGGEAVAFWAGDGENQLLLPLLVEPVPASLGAPVDWLDAHSPYGYGCPLFTPGCNRAAAGGLLDAFRELARERGMVSAFVRLHPLLSCPLEAFVAHGDVVLQGKTVYMDLGLCREELWRQTRSDHRCGIRKLEKSGYRVVMDDWTRYREFTNTYFNTMCRLVARPFYFFSGDYFEGIHDALGDNLHLCVVLAPNGEVAAGGLFSAINGIVQYHVAGSSEKFQAIPATKLMLDFVRWWAKGCGFRFFHLGGGVGGEEDSLFQFKAGFSRLLAEFYTYRVVLDHQKYEHLMSCRRSNDRLGVHRGDFFPQYRAELR